MIEKKYLKLREIENISKDLILKHNRTDNIYDIDLPIPVEDIAESTIDDLYGFNFSIEPIADNFGGTTLGVTEFEKKIIIIDENLYENGHEGRKNFTIAHEIGHVVLHSESMEANERQTSFSNLQLNCKTNNGKQNIWLEIQSNIFASCLLMPRELIIKTINELELADSMTSDQLLDELKKIFNVSRISMKYRLERLELLQDSEQLKLDFNY